MPTYQYACTACDERLEVVQKFTDDPLSECPACLGRLRKVFSPVGVVFKGSGFYRTDSRSTSQGKAGSSAAGAGSGTAGSAGSAGASDSSGSSDSAGSSPAKESASTSSGTSSSSGSSSAAESAA